MSGSFANLELEMPYGWRGTRVQVGNHIVLTTVAVAATTPPQVSATANGSQLQLAWPGTHTDWRWQAQTNALNAGSGDNWTNIAASNSPNQINVPIVTTNASVFFRLVYP